MPSYASPEGPQCRDARSKGVAFCSAARDSRGMSRKDPRCRFVVPITADQRAALRAMATAGARRRSLADRLRWIVSCELAQQGLMAPSRDLREAEQAADVVPSECTAAPTRGLPLQLPHHLLQKVIHLAQARGQTPASVVQSALAQHLARPAPKSSQAGG